MSQPPDPWKKKYLDTLEEFERKEERWQEADFALRRAISRLTFIADGIDPELDLQLERLRNRVRGEQDMTQLQRQVELLTSKAEAINNKERNQQDAPSLLVEAARQLVEENPFGSEFKGRVKRLRKELAKDPVPAGAASELRALVKEALQKRAGDSSSDGGVLKKIFSRKPADPAPPESAPSVAQEDSACVAPAGDDSSAVADVNRTPSDEPTFGLPEFFLQLAKLDELKARNRRLEQLAHRAKQVGSVDEIDQLCADLLDLLPQSATAKFEGQAESSDQSAIAPAAGVSAAEILLQLIEQLDISSDMQKQAQALTSRISKGVSDDELPKIVGLIVDLIEQTKSKAEEERQEVEQFLLQMTEQLQLLDQELKGVGQAGGALAESGRQHDQEVQSQVSSLQDHVKQAQDLDKLKLSVAERLTTLQDHLRNHRSKTEQQVKEFEERIDLLTEQVEVLEQHSADLKQSVEAARAEAYTDALTGLNNRYAFEHKLKEEYERWSRYHHPMSLIVVDVDHFKRVNDTFGHLAGDKVLHVIGNLMKQVTRNVDFPARYGGEEFVVLLPDTDIQAARGVAEKIRAAVQAKPFHSGDKRVEITVSCGIASFKQGDGRKVPFARADDALYVAKRNGRNRCCTEDQI